MVGNNNSRGFFGIWVPAEILSSDALTTNEKFIYAYIASYSKCCFDSNERIGARLNISKISVSRAVAKLAKLRLVEVQFAHGNSSKRKILATKNNIQQRSKTTFPQTFPQDYQNVKAYQNVKVAYQNVKPRNRGVAYQNVNQRIKEKKKNKYLPGLAGKGPAQQIPELDKPVRERFGNTRDFLRALKKWREKYSIQTFRCEPILTDNGGKKDDFL